MHFTAYGYQLPEIYGFGALKKFFESQRFKLRKLDEHSFSSPQMDVADGDVHLVSIKLHFAVFNFQIFVTQFFQFI